MFFVSGMKIHSDAFGSEWQRQLNILSCVIPGAGGTTVADPVKVARLRNSFSDTVLAHRRHVLGQVNILMSMGAGVDHVCVRLTPLALRISSAERSRIGFHRKT